MSVIPILEPRQLPKTFDQDPNWVTLIAQSHSPELQAERSVQISGPDRAALQELGVPILLPSFLPPDTYLSDVIVETEFDFKGYTLYYRYFTSDTAIATCFQIEYSEGGFGGPVPPNSQPLTTPAMASAGIPYNLYWVEEQDFSNQDSPFLSGTVFSDWIEVPGVQGSYRLSSGLIESELVRACNWIDPEMAALIVSSLEALKSD
ncbi:MAG: hypothetical protein Q6L68_08420 [Thermostichus sp. DG02_5_bins_236]